MEFDKFTEKYLDPNDESGFNEVIYARQAKIKTLKIRLKNYHLSDDDINKLIDIIVNAEMEMEKVKKSFNSKKYTENDLIKFQNKLVDIQNKMKSDFDSKLNKLLKTKYEKAKKILEERKKNQNK